jgi:hypothetical protein
VSRWAAPWLRRVPLADVRRATEPEQLPTRATPMPVQVAWTNGGYDASVHVGGVDISSALKSITMRLDADSVPSMVLHLDLVSGDVAGHEVVLIVPEATAAALRRLGWLSPGAVEVLTAENALLAAEAERLRAELADHDPQCDLRVIAARTEQMWADTAVIEQLGEQLRQAHRERDEARGEVERLRALLAEALTGWDAAQDWQISSAAGMRIGEIRREAGLS